MANSKAHYFCESCGEQVDKWDVSCPNCGKQFDSIKCPQCNYSGNAQEFSNGCPSCGFMSDEQKRAAAARNKTRQRKSYSVPMPSPHFVSAGSRIFLVLFLLAIIVGLSWWIKILSV